MFFFLVYRENQNAPISIGLLYAGIVVLCMRVMSRKDAGPSPHYINGWKQLFILSSYGAWGED